MKVSNPWIIAVLVIASIGLLSLLFVIIHMYFHANFSELRVILLMMLHVTLFWKNLADLPSAWKSDPGFCQFMGFFLTYTSIANIIVIAFLGTYHYSYIIAEQFAGKIHTFIRKYAIIITLTVPLIAVLPYTTHSYGMSLGQWCDLPSHSQTANDWDLVIYFYPALIIVFITTLQFAYSTYRIIKYQPELFKSLFLSTGSYILVSVIFLVPRIAFRLSTSKSYTSSNVNAVLSLIPLEFAGILYFCVYVLGLYMLPEQIHHPSNASAGQTTEDLSFRISSLRQIIDDVHSASPSLHNSQAMYSTSASTSVLTAVVLNPMNPQSPPPTASSPPSSPTTFEETSLPVDSENQLEKDIELNNM